MRGCQVNFQCWGVILIGIIVGHIALTVGAGRECLDIFPRVYLFFLPLWEMVRYRLKYCLNRPLNPINLLTMLEDRGRGLSTNDRFDHNI